MLRELLSKMKLSLVRRKFRFYNRHNGVFPVTNFPIRCVSVGKNTYGPLSIIWMVPFSTKLIIGNYCSIGPSVTFLVGGGA